MARTIVEAVVTAVFGLVDNRVVVLNGREVGDVESGLSPTSMQAVAPKTTTITFR